MTTQRELGHALAAAFLEPGAWDAAGLAARGAALMGMRPRWLGPVVRAVLAAYARPPRDRPRELGAYVGLVLAERRVGSAGRPVPGTLARWPTPAPAMGRAPWPVPELPTAGDLAAFLGLSPGELAWFADVQGRERTAAEERLRHYRYGLVPRSGGRVRVLERPKARLKAVQRRLLHELLAPVPAHAAAHGFVAGRSARSHAARHAGSVLVVALDLEDCFARVRAGRIFAIWRTLGYPERVAHVLTGLCTNVVPAEALPPDAQGRLRRALATPHLPQGAPTSPALMNLAAHGLDTRLAALAAAWDATYTRYADDLTFSGGRGLRAVAPVVAAIAREEGFRVNAAKTRAMPRSRRQRVTGIVVNVHPNVARDEYDRLRATLHRAALDGPGELRRDVVLGRIAWVAALHPARGAKLRARFDAITWPGG